LAAWEADEEGGWTHRRRKSLTCTLKEVPAKDGTVKKAGRGYLWTEKAYENFELTLSYKLSPAANSGLFFRTDPKNPVQGGFEIQLMDDAGFKKTHPVAGARNLNGSLYDAVAPSAYPTRPRGEWNQLARRLRGFPDPCRDQRRANCRCRHLSMDHRRTKSRRFTEQIQDRPGRTASAPAGSDSKTTAMSYGSRTSKSGGCDRIYSRSQRMPVWPPPPHSLPTNPSRCIGGPAAKCAASSMKGFFPKVPGPGIAGRRAHRFADAESRTLDGLRTDSRGAQPERFPDCHLRSAKPIALDPYSEPEPDVAIVRGDIRDYQAEHPSPAKVLLVIEVSDSTLRYDRTRKEAAYAAAGIPEYWVVNLIDRQLEVFLHPSNAGYQDRTILRSWRPSRVARRARKRHRRRRLAPLTL